MNRKSLLVIASVLGAAVLFLAVNTYLRIREWDRKQEESASPAFPLPSFQFTDEEGRNYSSGQLQGRVWVANFIFTRCPGPCLSMTKEMAQVQKKLDRNSDIHLVSFTVDPDYDKPEVLQAYARLHGAKPERWTFLTGDRQPLHTLIEKGFKLSVAEAAPEQIAETGPFIHSTLFVVVGRDGKTVGYLDGSASGFQEKMGRLLKRAERTKS